MNYWIFIVTDKKKDGEYYSGEEILDIRLEDEFWGIGRKTPNRKHLQKGDKVIFYIGNPKKEFGGTATLASSCINLDEYQKNKYAHGKEVFSAHMGVLLDEVEKWEQPKPIEDLVPDLNFIENKEYWFSYFQGGVRQITEEDYKIIIGVREKTLVESITTSKDLESQAEFALEVHLEEFIYRNWASIDWDSSLDLYQTDEQDGRQFPAGTWSIDFLAVDRSNNDLVVVELKRGKTSDATVGQVLRYVNWVQENIAGDKQTVRGIIIAREIDESLKYAIRSLKNIEAKTYKVDFQLITPIE